MTGQRDAFGQTTGRAELSGCGRYRYTLERRWAEVPRYVLWLMLNPSTADASIDDPTIKRCLGFSRLWGYTGILVGNLYAWRSRYPRELFEVAARGDDPIGPDNQRWLESMTARAALIVCAWGQQGPFTAAKFQAMQLLRPPRIPHYLRMTRAEEPGHPLYLSSELRPTPWDFFTRPTSNGTGG